MTKKRLIAIVSPPYSEINQTTRGSLNAQEGKVYKDIRKGRAGTKWELSGQETIKYSENPQNIGNLKDSKIVGLVSPPYGLGEGIGHAVKTPSKLQIALGGADLFRYGSTKGNIGNIHATELKDTESFDISQFHSCEEPLEWLNLYGSDVQFKKFINPDTFAHPAKMSLLLCDRIFKHLKKLGLLKQNDVICDFMAGSGRTNLMASLHGFDSIAVELEPHFIKMINQNKSQFEKITGKKANWQVIQGDSRKLSELLNGSMVGIVSPPYEHAIHQSQGGIVEREKGQHSKGSQLDMADGYSWNKNNIGNLPDKQIIGITSPPFEEALSYTSDKYEPDKYPFVKGRKQFNQETGQPQKYGITNGNLGNQQGESYLSAMLQVYKEASKLMPIIVTVTKNPTRKGKLRRLDLDTARLLMLSGYQIVDYHRAILFTEDRQKTLTGLTKKEVRGRLSFFKRLSMQKGNVVAQWEDVLIGVRMDLLQHTENNMIAITSPPFINQNDHERPLDSTRNKNNRHNISFPYSDKEDNIGNLKDKQIIGITSPPFLDAPKENRIASKNLQALKKEGRIKANVESKYMYREKGLSSNNISNLPDKPIKKEVNG